MRCSPYYKDKNGIPKNTERLEVQSECNEHCLHYKTCLNELKLPKDFKVNKVKEFISTEKEIKEGRYHIDESGIIPTKKTWKKIEK